MSVYRRQLAANQQTEEQLRAGAQEQDACMNWNVDENETSGFEAEGMIGEDTNDGSTTRAAPLCLAPRLSESEIAHRSLILSTWSVSNVDSGMSEAGLEDVWRLLKQDSSGEQIVLTSFSFLEATRDHASFQKHLEHKFARFKQQKPLAKIRIAKELVRLFSSEKPSPDSYVPVDSVESAKEMSHSFDLQKAAEESAFISKDNTDTLSYHPKFHPSDFSCAVCKGSNDDATAAIEEIANRMSSIEEGLKLKKERLENVTAALKKQDTWNKKKGKKGQRDPAPMSEKESREKEDDKRSLREQISQLNKELENEEEKQHGKVKAVASPRHVQGFYARVQAELHQPRPTEGDLRSRIACINDREPPPSEKEAVSAVLVEMASYLKTGWKLYVEMSQDEEEAQPFLDFFAEIDSSSSLRCFTNPFELRVCCRKDACVRQMHIAAKGVAGMNPIDRSADREGKNKLFRESLSPILFYWHNGFFHEIFKDEGGRVVNEDDVLRLLVEDAVLRSDWWKQREMQTFGVGTLLGEKGINTTERGHFSYFSPSGSKDEFYLLARKVGSGFCAQFVECMKKFKAGRSSLIPSIEIAKTEFETFWTRELSDNGNAVMDAVAIILYTGWKRWGKKTDDSGAVLEVPADLVSCYNLATIKSCVDRLYVERRSVDHAESLRFWCQSSDQRTTVTSQANISGGKDTQQVWRARLQDQKRKQAEVSPDLGQPIYPLPRFGKTKTSAEPMDVVKRWKEAFYRIDSSQLSLECLAVRVLSDGEVVPVDATPNGSFFFSHEKACHSASKFRKAKDKSEPPEYRDEQVDAEYEYPSVESEPARKQVESPHSKSGPSCEPLQARNPPIPIPEGVVKWCGTLSENGRQTNGDQLISTFVLYWKGHLKEENEKLDPDGPEITTIQKNEILLAQIEAMQRGDVDKCNLQAHIVPFLNPLISKVGTMAEKHTTLRKNVDKMNRREVAFYKTLFERVHSASKVAC